MVKLNPQQPAPDFRLPSSLGVDLSLRDYRHQQPVVLFFAHSAECPRCRQRLQGFVEHYDDYRFWQAEILAVIPEPLTTARQLAETLGLPFPVLSDVDGSVRSQYVGMVALTDLPRSAVFVLDRFGAPEAWDVASDADELMAPDEALAWVQHGELACPECGVTEWPFTNGKE